MCCRTHCGCSCGCGCNASTGCGSTVDTGCSGTGTNGTSGCQRPNCGWAYICQYPGHYPMPLAERASAFQEESGCGCG